jgi:hypothetical protein
MISRGNPGEKEIEKQVYAKSENKCHCHPKEDCRVGRNLIGCSKKWPIPKACALWDLNPQRFAGEAAFAGEGCETAAPCDPWHCSRLHRVFVMSMLCRQNNWHAGSQVAYFQGHILTCVMRLPETNSPMNINAQRHVHSHDQSPFFLPCFVPIESVSTRYTPWEA